MWIIVIVTAVPGARRGIVPPGVTVGSGVSLGAMVVVGSNVGTVGAAVVGGGVGDGVSGAGAPQARMPSAQATSAPSIEVCLAMGMGLLLASREL